MTESTQRWRSFYMLCLLSQVFQAKAIAANSRREFLQVSSAAMSSCLFLPTADASYNPTAVIESITVPLEYIPSLSAYVLYYNLGGDRFGAIIDTGSPFLTVPNYCDATKWGCYHAQSSIPSGLPDTTERFDNNQGLVEWRRATFSFSNATGSMIGPSLFTFGVLPESLMDGSGGVFFGLVRDTDKWIRPSFLGQTSVSSFQIDLASTQKSLTLTSARAETLLTTSSASVVADKYIRLVKDLNQRYGDPTIHYTAKATAVTANGQPLAARDSKPIYVIFDTGVSGMVVSPELLDERYRTARRNRERNLWGDVQISFPRGISLSCHKPVTTPLGEKPWPNFNAHLIVVGLSFLDDRILTVDIDQQRLWIT